MTDIRVFGVRHHGPGCARSLQAELEAWVPDAVLVEGPPDANDALGLLDDEGWSSPVALLVYPPDEPGAAIFYPFCDWSPEWVALRWARAAGAEARFIDLPHAIRVRRRRDAEAGPVDAEPDAPAPPDEGEPAAPEAPDAAALADAVVPRPFDAIGALAQAAGFVDDEAFWDHLVEGRPATPGLFEGLLGAMEALRAARDEEVPADAPHRPLEDLREAWMRQEIRRAKNEGLQRIAVVCGAWHAPVLTWDFNKRRGRASSDRALLKGLRKVKTTATWVPWSHRQLARRSGYGAGVQAPGWHRLLWEHPDGAALRWLGRVAAVLRDEGYDVSSAHVIEALRLAEALAALRDLPRPGLPELNQAVAAALFAGEAGPLRFVRDRLEIGDRLGAVPGAADQAPLQRDLARKQKSLRLKPSADERPLDLDLRTPGGRARSHLLHQLLVLEVPWGQPQQRRAGLGSFHELWTLRWRPSFVVGLIEGSTWGNTTEAAASRRLEQLAIDADLPTLTALLDRALLAALPAATAHLLAAVRDRAAGAGDVSALLDAVPRLVTCLRYGDVRATPTEAIEPIVVGLLERLFAGLPPGCSGLGDEAAAELVAGLASVAEAIARLERPALDGDWTQCLASLAGRAVVAPRIRGWATRQLLERGVLDDEGLTRAAAGALSPADPPAEVAAWLEGFLSGTGLVLLHRDGFWRAFDAWLSGLAPPVFVELLPPLRRGFSGFAPSERQAMGRKVRALGTGAVAAAPDEALKLHPERAAALLPTLAAMLGVPLEAP